MDIQLIETDVLLKELVNRFDHAVFMGIRLDTLAATSKTETGIYSCREWVGNSYTCVGLCQSLSRNILNSYDDKENECKPDDI